VFGNFSIFADLDWERLGNVPADGLSILSIPSQPPVLLSKNSTYLRL
jgi:hypothetical protein